MVLSEDLDCGVCLQTYNRSERVPRMLFCNHTFCSPCLESLAAERRNMLSVRCPLCRQVSCIRLGLSLQETLWVNSCLWDFIPEDEDEHQEEEVHEVEKTTSSTVQAASPAQTECVLRPNSRHLPKLRLPNFLKKLSFPKLPQDRIVPGCNVQMKSWRPLSGEETV